jgi:hypothetical protein
VGFVNSAGNHVIRYNDIWGDDDHNFNDAIGAGSNFSFEGSRAGTATSTGIRISHAWDDGIEAEGANDWDWDLYSGRVNGAPGQETNGVQGVPVYEPTHGDGGYRLAPSSPGFDDGVRLPGFNDGFAGEQAAGTGDGGRKYSGNVAERCVPGVV